MAEDKVGRILQKHKILKAEKQPWLTLYQKIGEFFFNRKQDFTNVRTPGSFLLGDIFGNMGFRNLSLMASSLIGALWQNGAQSIEIIPPRNMPVSEQIKQYYNFMSTETIRVMDNPKSGLVVALEEYMLDQGAFGTSGVAVFRNPNPEKAFITPYKYNAWDVKAMSIEESEDGTVDTVYSETERTVSKVVKTFGLKNVSARVAETFNKGRGSVEKVRVLHAIEPRMAGDATTFGINKMPIASIHIDIDSKKVMRESGFTSMPVFVTRFTKTMNEVYGRSPAMSALPDVAELSAIREALTLGIEKSISPPMGVLSDGDLTPIVDTSPDALNVFNVSGRLGSRQPIFPLNTVGELRGAEGLINELKESIANHFFIDRLLDLNNKTRMTLGEAQIRNSLRAASLGSIFNRQIAELFVPMIERTIELMFEDGRFGSFEEGQQSPNGVTIPQPVMDAILSGSDVFEIKFISPAVRAMQSEKLQGIFTTMEFTTQAAGLNPEAIDNFNIDETVQTVSKLSGAPVDILTSAEERQVTREQRAEAQQRAQQLEEGRQQSEIARNVAQSQKGRGKGL